VTKWWRLLQWGISSGSGSRPIDLSFHDPEIDREGSVHSGGNGGWHELGPESTATLLGVRAGGKGNHGLDFCFKEISS
jgi:hypothetical protein